MYCRQVSKRSFDSRHTVYPQYSPGTTSPPSKIPRQSNSVNFSDSRWGFPACNGRGASPDYSSQYNGRQLLSILKKESPRAVNVSIQEHVIRLKVIIKVEVECSAR